MTRMCGILGLSTTSPDAIDASRFAAALRLMRARGPDDSGYVFCPPHGQVAIAAGDEDTDPAIGLPSVSSLPRGGWRTALGSRRLAIQDPSPHGHQPMGSEDRRYWIVFNGEIYNFPALRLELIAAGHRFRSSGDTEVLLKAYQEWGTVMLGRLVGMFAFAILDTERGVIFLARDFFGIKPLLISRTADTLAFSSDARALLAFLPGATVNTNRLIDFLACGATDNTCETMIEGVWQLPAAHFVTIDLGCPDHAVPQRYWRLQPISSRALAFRDAVAGTRDLFLESLELHLRSDAPLGAGLSGGIDSSAIVFGIRHLRGRAADIPTFSYVAEQVPSDGPWIATADELARTRPHHFSVGPTEIRRDIDHMIGAQGEPVESFAVLAQYQLFRTAAAALASHLAEGVDIHLPSLLRCEDRNAMAWSVESRVPFLTPRFAEFVLGLPEEFLIDDHGTSKAVFRAAMRGIVPDELLNRRRKVGFASLHPLWFGALGPWAANVLDAAEGCQLIDVSALRRAWDRLQTATRAGEDALCRVWRGLNTLCWAQRFGLSGL